MLAVVALGLAMRFNPLLPEWLRDAAGGVCYVCLMALLVRLARPLMTPLAAAAAALAVTCAVEFAQLWHPAWLEAVRATLPGRLALGTTFSWSDFPPYFAGAALAAWLKR